MHQIVSLFIEGVKKNVHISQWVLKGTFRRKIRLYNYFKKIYIYLDKLDRDIGQWFSTIWLQGPLSTTIFKGPDFMHSCTTSWI